MKKKVIIVILLFLMFVVGAIIIVKYYSTKNWYTTWESEGIFDEKSAYLQTMEAWPLEVENNIRLEYSYQVQEGGYDLVIAKDVDGKDVVKSLDITVSTSGCFDFAGFEPGTYYIYETAKSFETRGTSQMRFQKYLSRWETRNGYE